jgi:fused signal recognition particle receptor
LFQLTWKVSGITSRSQVISTGRKKSRSMFGWFRKKEKADEAEREGLIGSLKQGLSKTRAGFTGKLDQLLFGDKEISGELLEDVEEVLFTSDLGVTTTQELIQRVQEGVARKELDKPDKLREALKEQIRLFLDVREVDHTEPSQGEPLVIMMIGVNGVGKTTTIGKVAHVFREEGKSVMLVAGDTFRAAAIEQLQIWGERVGAEVVKQKEGSDPSAVVYDALSAAISREINVVLIDTAGRLHTKTNLMDELEKIHRIAGKRLPGSPHEVWLVLDATTGQNAIAQAETFNKALHVTGMILTKLDGTAKGGIVVGICHQLKIPVRFIGIGEKLDDLRPFDASEFVEAIFG